MFFVSSFLKWNDTGLWQDPWMHVLHGLALQNDLKRAAAVSTRGEIPILLRDGQSFQSRWIYDKRINMVAACPLLASATRCILTCVCITGIRINHCNTVGKGVCHEYVQYSECTWGMIWTLIKLIYFSKRIEIPCFPTNTWPGTFRPADCCAGPMVLSQRGSGVPLSERGDAPRNSLGFQWVCRMYTHTHIL